MEHQIHIGDFVKLTGSTLKTVLYYHKIGLLPEPERTESGYRLYGAEELSRMQLIRHLRGLGLDLPRIKNVLGEKNDGRAMPVVLLSLREELANEKQSLTERIAKIDALLQENNVLCLAGPMDSASFQMISEILGADKMAAYAKDCPKLFEQHQKVFGILDDFQWGKDYTDNFQALAAFFEAHPQAYETALAFGTRLAKLVDLSENDPEVDALAKESAAFIKEFPSLKELVFREPEMEKTQVGLYHDMVATVKSPAQIKMGELLQKYLAGK